jgi:hypothetical protein
VDFRQMLEICESGNKSILKQNQTLNRKRD